MNTKKLSNEDKKFMVDIELIRSTIEKQASDRELIRNTITKQNVEIEKFRADTTKSLKETHRYDLTIGIALALAIVAITKLFL